MLFMAFFVYSHGLKDHNVGYRHTYKLNINIKNFFFYKINQRKLLIIPYAHNTLAKPSNDASNKPPAVKALFL